MTIAFKLISLLLSYPSRELQEEIPALNQALEEDGLVTARQKQLIRQLGVNIAALDLYDAQERYVYLFDRTRSLSLHLFEHVHGESRDRGQAMVDLKDMYEQHGFAVDARELPDYLPLFLEFLSLVPEREAKDLLGQTAHIISVLKQRLKKRKSIYANAFAVLEAIAAGKPDRKLIKELLETEDDDPADLAALDKIWQEEAVTFGGNAGDNACGIDRLRRQIRADERKPAATGEIGNV